MAAGQPLRNQPNLQRFLIVDARPTGRLLGVGSYGRVEELEVGGVVCAGKKIHESLIEQGNLGADNIASKYEVECQLMSDLRHPHLVQFLGVCFLPDSTQPVLVMERLLTNLDELLEHNPDIPLSLKRSILADVARGLVYLHSRSPPVIHRDLSAKNVLLTAAMVAKITDLGNARIVSFQRGQLACTLSRIPGTLHYMPPEALHTTSKYGPSLDSFSFGHLSLYTITQEFPCELLDATYRNPENSKRRLARTEVERRDKYIKLLHQQLGEQHPLVLLVEQCLDDEPSERPSAQQLLQQLESMKAQIKDPYQHLNKLKAMTMLMEKDTEIRDLHTQVAAMRMLREKGTENQDFTQEEASSTSKQELVGQQTQMEQLQLVTSSQLAAKLDSQPATKDDQLAAKEDEFSILGEVMRRFQLATSSQLAAKEDQLSAKDDEIPALGEEMKRLQEDLDARAEAVQKEPEFHSHQSLYADTDQLYSDATQSSYDLGEDLDDRAEAVRKEPEFHSQQSLYADTDQLYPDATQSSYDLGEDLDDRAEAVRKEPEFHSQQSLYADTDQLYPDATQSSYDLGEDLDNRAEAVRKEPEFHSQQSLYADTDQLYPDATQSSYDLGEDLDDRAEAVRKEPEFHSQQSLYADTDQLYPDATQSGYDLGGLPSEVYDVKEKHSSSTPSAAAPSAPLRPLPSLPTSSPAPSPLTPSSVTPFHPSYTWPGGNYPDEEEGLYSYSYNCWPMSPSPEAGETYMDVHQLRQDGDEPVWTSGTVTELEAREDDTCAYEPLPQLHPVFHDIKEKLTEDDSSSMASGAASSSSHTGPVDHIYEVPPGLLPNAPGTEVIGMYDCNGSDASELTFKCGDTLTIISKSEYPNWYKARSYDGQEGLIPDNFVQEKHTVIHTGPKRAVTLQSMPWFHGELRQKNVEKLLKPYRNGKFLVREANRNKGDYALCVSFKNKVKSYRIRRNDKNWVTLDDEQYFANLIKLVQHFQTDAGGLCCELQYPVEKISGSIDCTVSPQDFTESGWVVPKNRLQKKSSLDRKGEFKEVWLGEYQGQKVAITTIKDTRDEKITQEYLTEAAIMTTLQHPNLVCLIGVCLDESSFCFITEYMAKGSLLGYLMSRGRADISKLNQLSFARDVSKGMVYMESQNLVHRKLAARSVLIGDDNTAKISDFNLTRNVLSLSTREPVKLLVKWTAPEAFRENKFSNKSDVWSFGILLWEIYSYGRVPYPRVSVRDVITHVEQGNRMDVPDGCTKGMCQLMQDCWNKDASQRPTFDRIEKMLSI